MIKKYIVAVLLSFNLSNYAFADSNIIDSIKNDIIKEELNLEIKFIENVFNVKNISNFKDVNNLINEYIYVQTDIYTNIFNIINKGDIDYINCDNLQITFNIKNSKNYINKIEDYKRYCVGMHLGPEKTLQMQKDAMIAVKLKYLQMPLKSNYENIIIDKLSEQIIKIEKQLQKSNSEN